MGLIESRARVHIQFALATVFFSMLLVFTFYLFTQAETPCPPDPFEPNENPAQAFTLSPGTYPDLRICSGDRDWFRIDLGRTDRISATIRFPHPQGDLDLYLMDESGRRALDASTHTGPSGEEHVVYTTTEPTHVFLRVVGYRGATNAYTLTLQRDRTDDRFEPNDTPAQAPLITPGTYRDLIIVPDNPDFYAIHIPDNSTVQVGILFRQAQGDLDLWLTNRTGHSVASSTSSTDNEWVVYPAMTGGTYYIYVAGYRHAGNAYTLIYRMERIGACQEDAWAPNGSRDAAAPVDFGTYEMTLCPDTEDWFWIHGPGAGVLEVRIAFEHMLGDLDLKMWGAEDAGLLGASTGITNLETISRAFDAPFDAYVEVYGHDLVMGVPYTLSARWATFTPTPTPTSTPTPTPTSSPTFTPTSTPTPVPRRWRTYVVYVTVGG